MMLHAMAAIFAALLAQPVDGGQPEDEPPQQGGVEATERALAALRAKDPAWVAPVLSAVLCEARAAAAAARRELADRLQEARVGGVLDVRDQWFDQEVLRDAQARARWALGALRRIRRVPTSCHEVRTLAACLGVPVLYVPPHSPRSGICYAPDVQMWLRIYDQL